MDGSCSTHRGELDKKLKGEYLRFEVLTALIMMITVFWYVRYCKLVDRYQCFARTCCFNLQGRITRACLRYFYKFLVPVPSPLSWAPSPLYVTLPSTPDALYYTKDKEGHIFLRNVRLSPNYTELKPRRSCFSK
jgi:hypothetical protein